MKCGGRAKHTPSTLNLHTVWPYDLRALPSRGWFYFPAFNGPSAPGARAPLRWRERNHIFWPLHTSNSSGCPALFHSDGAGLESVSLMSVNQHTGCCCWKVMIIGVNDVMFTSRPHAHTWPWDTDEGGVQTETDGLSLDYANSFVCVLWFNGSHFSMGNDDVLWMKKLLHKWGFLQRNLLWCVWLLGVCSLLDSFMHFLLFALQWRRISFFFNVNLICMTGHLTFPGAQGDISSLY